MLRFWIWEPALAFWRLLRSSWAPAPPLHWTPTREAVRVAHANCAANGVADQIQVAEGSLAEVLSGHLGRIDRPFVVVNILAQVIRTLFAQGLTEAVTPDGLLILSGLVQAQTPEIRAALHWHGLHQIAQEQRDGWVCVIARRS